MEIVKGHIKEELKPYVPYTELLKKIRQRLPGTEESGVSELIGILKNEKRLDEAKIRRARLFFPVAMVRLYLSSSHL